MKHVHHVSCLRNLLRTLIGCKTIEQCPPRHLWSRPVKVPDGLIIFKGTDRRNERTKQPDTVNEPPWVAQVNGGWLKDRGALSRILLHSYILSKRSKILTSASIQAGYRCTPIYEGRPSLMCLFCGHYPIRPVSHPTHASARAFSYRSSKIWFCALMNRIPMRKVIFKWAKRIFSIPK